LTRGVASRGNRRDTAKRPTTSEGKKPHCAARQEACEGGHEACSGPSSQKRHGESTLKAPGEMCIRRGYLILLRPVTADRRDESTGYKKKWNAIPRGCGKLSAPRVQKGVAPEHLGARGQKSIEQSIVVIWWSRSCHPFSKIKKNSDWNGRKEKVSSRPSKRAIV